MSVICRECGKTMGPAHTQAEFDRRICFACASKAARTQGQAAKKSTSIRGWLYLMGANLIVTAVMALVQLASFYYALVDIGMWDAMSNKRSPFYDSTLAGGVLAEVGMYLALTVGHCTLVYLFFKRRSTFPRVYIAIALAIVAVLLIDLWIAWDIFGDGVLSDPQTQGNLVGAILSATIWIPYMLTSKRVKRTFVRGRDETSARTVQPQNLPGQKLDNRDGSAQPKQE